MSILNRDKEFEKAVMVINNWPPVLFECFAYGVYSDRKVQKLYRLWLAAKEIGSGERVSNTEESGIRGVRLQFPENNQNRLAPVAD